MTRVKLIQVTSPMTGHDTGKRAQIKCIIHHQPGVYLSNNIWLTASLWWNDRERIHRSLTLTKQLFKTTNISASHICISISEALPGKKKHYCMVFLHGAFARSWRQLLITWIYVNTLIQGQQNNWHVPAAERITLVPSDQLLNIGWYKEQRPITQRPVQITFHDFSIK